jgi:uncharacterized protein YggE
LNLLSQQRSSHRRATTAVLIGLLAAFLFASSLVFAAPMSQERMQADESEKQSSMTILGEAEVRAKPDIATVTIGVAQTAATAEEAVDAMNSALAAVLAGIRSQGVEDRDIQTARLSLQPIYRPPPAPSVEPHDPSAEITGYRAVSLVSVTVRELERTGSVVDAAMAGGANQIGGIRFGLADAKTIERKALIDALADANVKAQAAATAAGVQLGSVHSITEFSAAAPRADAIDLAPVGSLAGTPVEAGELRIRAQVRVVYEIGDAQ